MSVIAGPGEVLTGVLLGAPQGLVGQLTRAVRAVPSGTVVVPASASGIVEFPQPGGTSNYEAPVTAPTLAGHYELVWVNPVPTPDLEVTEPLEVTSSLAAPPSPYVVSLFGFRPTPRADGIPWTRVQVEEAPAMAGPWALLEEQALTPVDANPAAPAARDVTSDRATLQAGWYRLVFLDAAGVRDVSDAVPRGVLSGPSVSEVRRHSPLIRQLYPADPYDGEREQELADLVQAASTLVGQLTCRAPLSALTDPDLLILATQAVAMKVEGMAVTGAARTRRGSVGSLRLRSFSAGPYSESYFGPEEAGQAKILDPDPDLHRVLWLLATEECRQKWMRLWGIGDPEPFGQARKVDWVAGGGRPLGRLRRPY